MKGCCFLWPYRTADRVKKPKLNFSSARNLFTSRGLPHDYDWVFSSTNVIIRFKIKDRKCIKMCMTPEFRADVGSKWILALWVCMDLVSLCWEAQGGRGLCLVMRPVLSLCFAYLGWTAFEIGVGIESRILENPVWGRSFQNWPGLQRAHWGESPNANIEGSMRMRGGCWQWLIHWSLVPQWAARNAVVGNGSRAVP